VVPVRQGALTDRCRHDVYWKVGVPAQRGVDLFQVRACLSADQGHGAGLPVQVIAQLGIARDHGDGHLVHVDGHGLLGERGGVILSTHALILPWLWGEGRGLARTGTPPGLRLRPAALGWRFLLHRLRHKTPGDTRVRQRHRQGAPWPVVAPTSGDARTRGAHTSPRPGCPTPGAVIRDLSPQNLALVGEQPSNRMVVTRSRPCPGRHLSPAPASARSSPNAAPGGTN